VQGMPHKAGRVDQALPLVKARVSFPNQVIGSLTPDLKRLMQSDPGRPG